MIFFVSLSIFSVKEALPRHVRWFFGVSSRSDPKAQEARIVDTVGGSRYGGGEGECLPIPAATTHNVIAAPAVVPQNISALSRASRNIKIILFLVPHFPFYVHASLFSVPGG